ncbi:MAG: transposase [Terriglobales bacterium]
MARTSSHRVFSPSSGRTWSESEKNIGAEVFSVGGTANHSHVLLAIPPTLTLASAVQKIKGSSSKWMGDSGVRDFKWQEGYGAFSVSASAFHSVVAYIGK